MAVVTISREVGSSGREVAHTLAEMPGYRLLDHEGILEKIKSAGHKWLKWADEFDEHSPRLWERYDWSFRGISALVQSIILDEAAADRVVIVGRGANYLLAGIPFVLSVRITAPLETRIARISQRDGIDRDSARWLIEKTDRERTGFLYTVYGTDGRDPFDYNLAFDSSEKNVAEILEIIKGALEQRDLLRNEAAAHKLRMMALASRIKAALLTTLPFFLPTLDVVYADRAIHLRGVVRTPREYDAVLRKTREMAGTVPVEVDLRYR